MAAVMLPLVRFAIWPELPPSSFLTNTRFGLEFCFMIFSAL
jgi:hypothetical protein